MPGLLDIFAGAVAGGAKGANESLIIRLKEEAQAARDENLMRFQSGLKDKEIQASKEIAGMREAGEVERHKTRQEEETKRHAEIMHEKREAARLAEQRDERIRNMLQEERALREEYEKKKYDMQKEYYSHLRGKEKSGELTHDDVRKFVEAFAPVVKSTTDPLTGLPTTTTTQKVIPPETKEYLRGKGFPIGDFGGAPKPQSQSGLELILSELERRNKKAK